MTECVRVMCATKAISAKFVQTLNECPFIDFAHVDRYFFKPPPSFYLPLFKFTQFDRKLTSFTFRALCTKSSATMCCVRWPRETHPYKLIGSRKDSQLWAQVERCPEWASVRSTSFLQCSTLSAFAKPIAEITLAELRIRWVCVWVDDWAILFQQIKFHSNTWFAFQCQLSGWIIQSHGVHGHSWYVIWISDITIKVFSSLVS